MKSIIARITKSLYPDECSDKETSKIYKIHKYWARKPWYIVERYVNDYSKPNEVVLDPFCGSGLTGMEAVINGRNFIGQDLNPIALKVSSATIDNNFDLETFEQEFVTISNACKDRIMRLYASDEFCTQCNGRLYYRDISIGPKFGDKIYGTLFCSCGKKFPKHFLSDLDIQNIQEIDCMPILEWYPDTLFPDKFYKDRFSYKGIHCVADMFTHRNLLALSILLGEIRKIKSKNVALFELAFTNTLLHVSKLKGENVRPLSVNNYWIPDDYIEENVWFRFEERVNLIRISKKEQKKRAAVKATTGIPYGKYVLNKKSAIEAMGQECVDYVFTDPPYGEAIQYSELSFVWNAWLQERYQTQQEVVMNPAQNKGKAEFTQLLFAALDNIYSALKAERYFTLCFQNKNAEVWKDVIGYCKSLGFQLVDVSIYNTYGFPFNKTWANFSPKSDIYVTFKKTNKQLFKSYNKTEDITSIVKEIGAYMRRNKISVDNNKLYDLTISYLIWALFLNEQSVDMANFDIKKFTRIASEVLC